MTTDKKWEERLTKILKQSDHYCPDCHEEIESFISKLLEEQRREFVEDLEGLIFEIRNPVAPCEIDRLITKYSNNNRQ